MTDTKKLTERELDRIIEMTREDRTPFEAIQFQFGLPEKEVIKMMRGNLEESGFKTSERLNLGLNVTCPSVRKDTNTCYAIN